MAVLLALGLIMGLCVPAFAGEDNAQTGTVTIDNAKNGDIYKLYLLASKAGDQYVPVEGWGLTFDGAKVLYNGTEITEANVVDTAKNLLGLANDKDTEYVAEGSGRKAEFSNVPYGYYLVDYGNGMSGLFELNAESMVLEMKRNTEPTLEKKIVVERDGKEERVDYTTVDIGDIVKFEVTAILPDDPEWWNEKGDYYWSYTCLLEDQVSDGLQQNKDVAVMIDGEKYVKAGETEGYVGNIQTVANTVHVIYDNEKHFAVRFGSEKENGRGGGTLEFLLAHPGAEVTLTYSATVIQKAAQTPNEFNNVKLQYREYGNYIEDEVYIYDFTIVVDKYDSSNHEQLSGAKFALRNSEGDYYWTDGKSDGSYHVGDRVEWIKADFDPGTGEFSNYGEKPPSVWTTDHNNWKGNLTFGGINIGKYELIEVAAPKDYNKLEKPIGIEIKVNDDKDEAQVKFIAIVDGKVVDISANGIPWADDWKPLNFTVGVANSKGTILPSTGGMGTTLFYIGGGVLVIGAASFILFRKRGG
ncbi:SpaA isopeptide-forming pilin-related protein [Acutalibacter sp. 1XD8-36]|uniref:SpaA isopeptide-forming pilin-related protein n=1 Tax=Acutalibacter sp. 1XD8-36 TaxID=2320852 RepID=UPI001412313B|nr:isopeptide-forming domain-containing fimbrial protein [Acutalibacter sp. 1XD8-36]